MKTIRTIQGKECYSHHTASEKGYTRLSDIGTYRPYVGRFGTGFIEVLGKYYGSSHYRKIRYWVVLEKKGGKNS